MTAIEWTHIPGFKGETWNPVVGCSVVSPGCRRCYAMRLAGLRLRHTPAYAGLTRMTVPGPVWTGEVRLLAGRLDRPLRWREPRAVFVNSMGDLFHDGVPDDAIDRVFAVMALCQRHIFMVLTKRADRMREYMNAKGRRDAIESIVFDSLDANHGRDAAEDWYREWSEWPLPNLWLGVSAEDQERADDRVFALLRTLAARRFVSVEPMLGPVDPRRISLGKSEAEFYGYPNIEYCEFTMDALAGAASIGIPGLDWVIAGGESGAGARPMHPGWVRALRDQCAAAATPFFFKQWGPRRGGHVLDGAVHREWPLSGNGDQGSGIGDQETGIRKGDPDA